MSETIGETTIYYSLVKKDAKTLSFLTNDRLLVYDNQRRILFYINDFKNTPFKSALPNPKNEQMPIAVCNFSNPAFTNNLQIKYTATNDKG